MAPFNVKNTAGWDLSFATRAFSALGISLTADILDYVGSPIFAMPIIGDISDGIVTTLLYSITKSKTSTIINSIEFIPFIGDMIPTYTISTLMWIHKEWKKNNSLKAMRSRDFTYGKQERPIISFKRE